MNDHLMEQLLSAYDPAAGTIAGRPRVERRLSELAPCFADQAAGREVLRHADPLVYAVSTFAPADGAGDLHYGLAQVMPGRVGREYFMTKGHFHAWREAAEFYFTLSGEGLMLLEGETGGRAQAVPMRPREAVYVPGRTAHRTVNVGPEPLTFLGVYPARAGYDYGAIAARNFRHVIVARDGGPAMIPREEY